MNEMEVSTMVNELVTLTIRYLDKEMEKAGISPAGKYEFGLTICTILHGIVLQSFKEEMEARGEDTRGVVMENIQKFMELLSCLLGIEATFVAMDKGDAEDEK